MTKKNLSNADAKAKIKKLAEGIDFAMLATGLNSVPIHMIPMSTKKVDEDGNIWFLSGKDSKHNQNIAAGKRVHLVYSEPGSMQFMTVFGQATITTDKAVLKELYSSTDDAWFEGVEDPSLTAIQIDPTEAFYWDSKSNQLVSMFKIGAGAITGNQPDLMDQGKLNLS